MITVCSSISTFTCLTLKLNPFHLWNTRSPVTSVLSPPYTRIPFLVKRRTSHFNGFTGRHTLPAELTLSPMGWKRRVRKQQGGVLVGGYWALWLRVLACFCPFDDLLSRHSLFVFSIFFFLQFPEPYSHLHSLATVESN